MTQLPSKVRIVEVGPRDGLQNEPVTVPPLARAEFINRLLDAGLTTVEGGAFVHPDLVPQMAGTAEVLAAVPPRPGVSIPVLVPNEKGMLAAMAAGAREVAVFAAASEAFSQKNINCSIAKSLERFVPVMELARQNGIKVRGYVSCVLGCPYKEEVTPKKVAEVAKKLLDMGCYEISLGDTIGSGTPETTRAMLLAVKQVVPVEKIAVHFHDTGGRARDNLGVALEEGISVADASATGLGGCPFAPGASGNVATEQVIDMLHGMGIETGVDRDKVVAAGRFIRNILHPPAPGRNGGPVRG